MNIHEYQSKQVLREFGVNVPNGLPAFTVDEAVANAEKLGSPVIVVKAQIHAGGRGKAGGVKIAKKTGVALSCYTTQIGMQFYTGNSLAKRPIIGKGGKEFRRRGGFCLETQFFPNAPANPTFPQPELRMDEVWEAETVYKLDDL